jgi:signal transduction histidine kinase
MVRQTVRALPLFANVSPRLLEEQVLVGHEVRLRRGEELVRQGEPSRGFDILIEGRVEFFSTTGGERVHVITFDAPAFWGHEPLMADVPVPVTGLALEDSLLYRLEPDAFWAMVGACPGILRHLVRAVAERYQRLGENTHQQMRLVSLGTMAAGLAHELNNPAAAAGRAAHGLGEALAELARGSLALSGVALTDARRSALSAVAATSAEAAAAQWDFDALSRADREEELAAWLDAHGTPRAFELAAGLADGGIDRAKLEPLVSDLDRATATDVVSWLAAASLATGLAAEVSEAARRISELVGAIRSYSRLDQAPEQYVDVHEGIEATLKVMTPKLKVGIEVVRDYDRSLPRIPAHPGELNQVWTNLIDNAVDAMEGRGRLWIVTGGVGDRIAVRIEDEGPGVPAELRDRVFDPFFTTKPVGSGTGLGLDIARRIVTGRHRGDIRLQSDARGARFEVLLPVASP